jgi:N-glycosylase/DNA lyase
LWGKEAGWAHSVLFTADLRAFSERLKVEKVEKMEGETKLEDVSIKQEEVDGATPEELMIKQVKIEEQENDTKKRIKREDEEDSVKNVLPVEGFVRRSKRARKA